MILLDQFSNRNWVLRGCDGCDEILAIGNYTGIFGKRSSSASVCGRFDVKPPPRPLPFAHPPTDSDPLDNHHPATLRHLQNDYRRKWDKDEYLAKSQAQDDLSRSHAIATEAALASGKKPPMRPPAGGGSELPRPTKALEAREGDLGIEKNLGRVMVVGSGGKGPGAGFYVSMRSWGGDPGGLMIGLCFLCCSFGRYWFLGCTVGGVRSVMDTIFPFPLIPGQIFVSMLVETWSFYCGTRLVTRRRSSLPDPPFVGTVLIRQCDDDGRCSVKCVRGH